MKLFLAKDVGGMYLFNDEPVWDEETMEFYPKSSFVTYEQTDFFDDNTLKIGECKEIEIKL